MRWIFYVLIVANLALGAKNLWFSSESEVSRAEPSKAWQPPRGVRKVLLLGEPKSEALSEEAQGADVQGQEMCSWMGPFAEQKLAQSFIERLAALDVKSGLEVEKATAGTSHWVYLRPLDSRARARAQLKELQAKGIDSYIISKGELDNAISVGVFSELRLAQARLESLVKQGYEPMLRTVNRSVDEYWVSVEHAEARKISKKAWSKIVNEQFKLTERQKFCLDVASK